MYLFISNLTDLRKGSNIFVLKRKGNIIQITNYLKFES